MITCRCARLAKSKQHLWWCGHDEELMVKHSLRSMLMDGGETANEQLVMCVSASDVQATKDGRDNWRRRYGGMVSIRCRHGLVSMMFGVALL